MSEMSKERVEALASNILECHDVKPSEVKALADLALMALRERAEPIVYMNRFTGRAFELEQQPGADKDPDVYIPLYTAPPAPVAAGWIACSDRMPELNTRVLLYFPDYGGHIEDGCIGDEGDGHYHYFFDGDSLRHEPTHWMPLPEAPAKN